MGIWDFKRCIDCRDLNKLKDLVNGKCHKCRTKQTTLEVEDEIRKENN